MFVPSVRSGKVIHSATRRTLFCGLIITIFFVWAPVAPMSAQQRAPRIASITPSSLKAGSGATIITIKGSGFRSGASIRVRAKGAKGTGRDLTATSVTTNELQFHLPADLVSNPGTLELRVKNQGKVRSQWATLTVTK